MAVNRLAFLSMINEKTLTKKEKCLLFAMCLGDGYIAKPRTKNSNAEFECSHSIKQLKYLTWKRDLIYSILGGIKPPKITIRKIHLNVNNIDYEACRFSKTHSYFTFLRKLLYNGNIKELSREAMEMLTPQGLAIWFMDDGWGFNIKNRKGELTERMEIGISTDSFSKEENELIIETIKNKFGIKFRLGKKFSPNTKKELWQIKTNSQLEVKKFFELISPYIIDSMKYKITSRIAKIHECDTSKLDEDIV